MTIFLATVLGWYLVIFSLFVLFRREILNSVLVDLFNQRASMFILSFITLILGLMIVVSHNVWVMGWPVMVTILGWLILVSGVIRLFCLDYIMRVGKTFSNQPAKMVVLGLIFLVIGVLLLFHVYTH
ncbi:hypothetical protein N9Q05_02360 [bacterium]|nr:hypothetical protein [bacterium]